MIAHLTAFIFYTFAMAGILLIAFIVYKKMNLNIGQNSKGLIQIIDSCPIGVKKNLLIVKIKNEKFLIASGLEHTTFLSKLEDDIQLCQDDLKQNAFENYNNLDFSDELNQNLNKNYNLNEQKAKKDAYEYLYRQNQKLQNAKEIMQKKTALNKPSNNLQTNFKDLYSTNERKSEALKSKQMISRKELMQELLNDIHKQKSGSKF